MATIKERSKISRRELAELAKGVIKKIIYITLATADNKGKPWNSPVYSAFDNKFNFYWMSWTENQHSKNIKQNGNAFAVVFDSTAPEGTGLGVYMEGKASQLGLKDTKEIIKALKLLYGRKSKRPRKIKEFLRLFPRRVYKFAPKRIWLNSAGEINGNYIDNRIDITKEMKN